MSEKIRVVVSRNAERELRESLRRFLTNSWNETYRHELGDVVVEKMVDELSDETVGGILPNNNEHLLVAYIKNEIVGSCVYATRDGVTYIWGCYVSKAAQRSGIASSMLDLMFARTERPMVYQLTVLETSTGAIAFYESIGFKKVSDETFEIILGNIQKAHTMIRSLK